jgi:hypothetical protein
VAFDVRGKEQALLSALEGLQLKCDGLTTERGVLEENFRATSRGFEGLKDLAERQNTRIAQLEELLRASRLREATLDHQLAMRMTEDEFRGKIAREGWELIYAPGALKKQFPGWNKQVTVVKKISKYLNDNWQPGMPDWVFSRMMRGMKFNKFLLDALGLIHVMDPDGT